MNERFFQKLNDLLKRCYEVGCCEFDQAIIPILCRYVLCELIQFLFDIPDS